MFLTVAGGLKAVDGVFLPTAAGSIALLKGFPCVISKTVLDDRYLLNYSIRSGGCSCQIAMEGEFEDKLRKLALF
jgi:hypothetical protein